MSPKWICTSKLPSLPCFPPTVDPRWGISGKLCKVFNPHSLLWDFSCRNFSSGNSPLASPKFLGSSAFPRCCCDFTAVCFHEGQQDPYPSQDPYPGHVPVPVGNYWSVTQVSLPRTDTKRQSEMGILAFNKDEDMDESRFIPTPAATDSVSIS